MAQYTYLFADVLTGTILAELPCKEVSFGKVLNGAGYFRGTVPLSPEILPMEPRANTQGGKTAIYVDRDGVLVWGGILWTQGPYRSASRTFDVAAADFLSYFAKRYLAVDKVYANVDQVAIVKDLISYAQGLYGGNVGVSAVGVNSGVLRSQTWSGYELTEIARAIEDLAGADGGFDFGFDVAYSSARVPTVTLTLSYPRRGRPADATGLLFEYPGNVTDYEWPEDAERMANKVWGIGQGSGGGMLTASSALSGNGWPLLETVNSYRDVSDQSALQAHATADVNALKLPVALPRLFVKADQDPILGSYLEGDDARVRISDPWWPAPNGGGAGYDGTLRINQIDVTPSTNDSPEQVTLTMGPAAS